MRELAERARLVVVKRGPQGSMALQDGQIVYSPGLLVNAVDTTGAGDSFAAGLIFAHVATRPPGPRKAATPTISASHQSLRMARPKRSSETSKAPMMKKQR